MKQFEIIDMSGDAGIRAFGKDLSELFANAATGIAGTESSRYSADGH